jgi:hypothetical protein
MDAPRREAGLTTQYRSPSGDTGVRISWRRVILATGGIYGANAGSTHQTGDAHPVDGAKMTPAETAVLWISTAIVLLAVFFAMRPIVNAIEAYLLEKREHSAMRRLKMPFLAAAGSTIIIAVLTGQHLFPRWSEQDQLIGGLVIGALATVVLYAVMRAIAERNPQRSGSSPAMWWWCPAKIDSRSWHAFHCAFTAAPAAPARSDRKADRVRFA